MAWFRVQDVLLSRGELVFFADGKRFAAPDEYRVQMRTAAGWRDLHIGRASVLSNDITLADWPAVTTDQVRLIVRQPAGKRTRLVEFKLF